MVDGRLRVAGHQLLAAVFALAGRHWYLSTGCLHDQHAYCRSDRGQVEAKKPNTCKFGDHPCRCRCHRAGRHG